MNSIKIYYKDSGYPIKRNLLDSAPSDYSISKRADIFKFPGYSHYKLFGGSPFLGNSHFDFRQRRDTIWHFFNGVSFGRTPWVSTFETVIPRWGTKNKKAIEFGMKCLTSNYCKKLIAISECTQNFQLNYLENNFPDYLDIIAEKLTILHPPQAPLIESIDDKKLSGSSIIFTIIGSLFFLKGGSEVLTVFDRLLSTRSNLKLNIISTLEFGDTATQSTKEDYERALEIINKYPEQINHYESLPNSKVLDLLKESHIGLLPTYADTYGYSVLEAQAAGCPVITTDIRALPEINNNDVGWIINIPQNNLGKANYSTKTGRAEISNDITEQLEAIIKNIIVEPNQIKVKGENSLKKIRTDHDISNHRKSLKKIYEEIYEAQ